MFFADAYEVPPEGVVDVFGEARVGGFGVDGDEAVVGDDGSVFFGDFVEGEAHGVFLPSRNENWTQQ